MMQMKATMRITRIMAITDGTWHFSSLSITGLTRIKMKRDMTRGIKRDEQSFMTPKNNTTPMKVTIDLVLLSIVFPPGQLYSPIAKGGNIV